LALTLYNTATRRKEPFLPLREGRVGIYVCGITAYDLCHIGHARSAIVFDVLVRYLRARGYKVTYVRNFTDVDDKIIHRAKEMGKAPGEIADQYIAAFYQDMETLGVLKADKEPRATQHIDGMIEMISALMDLGYAYKEGNDVFFSVEAFKDYGSLSGRNLEDMQAGVRIAVDEKKRHPLDFALWKGAKPGEPRWPSPWGPGRPGWHIECSVMSNYFLGPSFDIHGGGKDLLFPHHENERAQSIAANDGSFARYWVHNGFVTIESEKMSKSLGNFLTIRDSLKSYHPEVLRLFLLSKHYRSPLDFSGDAVLDLQSGLLRIYRALKRLNDLIGPPEREKTGDSARLPEEPEEPFLRQFLEIMDDDLNTAGAIGLIFQKIREMNKALDTDAASLDRWQMVQDRDHLLSAARVLGFLQEEPAAFFEQVAGPEKRIDPEEIEAMIEERASARKEKNWAKADEIRERLRRMGVVLEDGSQGTSWRFDV